MSERRNVVLVTVDSLRADRTGVAGHDESLMPTLDGMAADGLTFTNAIAPGPATGRSVPATVTGEYPVRRDAGGSNGTSWGERVRHHLAVHDTFAERFSRMGYHTGAFSTNPWVSEHYDFDTGFDEFEDFVESETDEDGGSLDLRGDSLTGRLQGHLQDWWSNSDIFLPWEAFYDDVLEWIRTADRPYFLWVFLIDVHMPYHPPREYRSRSSVAMIPAHLWLLSGSTQRFGSVLSPLLVEAYDDTVSYTDEFLRRFVEDVGTDPLVVVHGDHGDEFGEHGAYGHGSNLCEEVINVPLVVANGPTGYVERPVSLRSMPTLLTELARGRTPDVSAPYVFTGNPTHLAVRGNTWKYVWRPDGGELYSLADGSEEPADDDGLRTVAERLVADWHEARAEKRRIHSAAERLSQQHRL